MAIAFVSFNENGGHGDAEYLVHKYSEGKKEAQNKNNLTINLI